ncbi:MAG: hypothetical protein PVI57_15330, partial [Gemmatimonadota bacterium]
MHRLALLPCALLAGALPCVPLTLLLPTSVVAQETVPADTSDDGRWETPGRLVVAASGDVIAYPVSRNDGENELRIRFLDEDSARVVPWGDDPTFSPDGRWLAWAVEPSKDERERLEASDEPAELDAGLLNLAGGEPRTFEGVRSFAFDAEGRHLALFGYAPEGGEGRGADLRVVDLGTGAVLALGNVGEYAWSTTGSLLATAVVTGGNGENGVQVYDAATGRLRSLDASPHAYSSFAWREGAPDLAVLRSVAPASEEGSAHEILAWRGLDGATPPPLTLEPGAAGLADTLEIVTSGGPAWSDDGTMISFGLRPAEDDEAAAGEGAVPEAEVSGGAEGADPDAADAGGEEEPELPDVQIWHSSDVRIFPRQQASRSFDERRTLLAVWHLDENRAVRLGTDLMADARLLEGWEIALEDTDEPYPWGAMFGRPYHDVWAVDVGTGEREKVLERVRYAWPSAGGRHVVSFDGSHYASLDLRTG